MSKTYHPNPRDLEPPEEDIEDNALYYIAERLQRMKAECQAFERHLKKTGKWKE